MLRRSVMIGMLGLTLVACGGASGSDAEADPPPNTDPKKGLVLVLDNAGATDDVFKQCDPGGGGGVMIYLRYHSEGGISTVRDHPECR
jgi:hypothetical protein